MDFYEKEADFENDLVKFLLKNGWSSDNDDSCKNLLTYPTEDVLIQNWANIIFQQNREEERLNEKPLTKSEMGKIITALSRLESQIDIYEFINDDFALTRDDGTIAYLKFFDRDAAGSGNNVYQIAQQPVYPQQSAMTRQHRGDLTLLINGMPLIHIELKRSNVSVYNACNQIKDYSEDGVFTGIFSLVQVFFAMTPSETLYFANPGRGKKFDRNYFFHWADSNNKPMMKWKEVATSLLSIPPAHELVGYFTIPDRADGNFKVMRSYQYYAVKQIVSKVQKAVWDGSNQRGGYVWHTTGSGKTLTSFKVGQILIFKKAVDKVVYLMDRIDLANQSFDAFANFKNKKEGVQDTKNTWTLVESLTDTTDASKQMIVTSIQKMSHIKTEEAQRFQQCIKQLNKMRIVFIIDECHRSTFGEMLKDIKSTFPCAMFFGFSGTPILEENKKKIKNKVKVKSSSDNQNVTEYTSADIFGDEILNRYTITDGIADGNVLSFHLTRKTTFDDEELREKVARLKAGYDADPENQNNKTNQAIYHRWMNEASMIEVENQITNKQYTVEHLHQIEVVKDILKHWNSTSNNGKFHAIFATNSIPEAIDYYKVFKKLNTELKITCLFDPHINYNEGDAQEYTDNKEIRQYKKEGLVEIMNDYNNLYNMKYGLDDHAKFKEDIMLRLAHNKPYERIHTDKNEQLDILIVVDQLLTGYDSKWVNTLYLDKILQYENLIQAFSRTNRLNGKEKTFGSIRYYRRPHTMQRNIDDAVAQYSGSQSRGIFVDKLKQNIEHVNESLDKLLDIYKRNDIQNFEKDIENNIDQEDFICAFNELDHYKLAAQLQGFSLDKQVYQCDDPNLDSAFEDDQNEGATKENTKNEVTSKLDSETYTILRQQYARIAKQIQEGEPAPEPGTEDEPVSRPGRPLINIDPEIVTQAREQIDAKVLNQKFDMYKRHLEQTNVSKDDLHRLLEELHKSFASLNIEQQNVAELLLHDIEVHAIELEPDKTFMDYINLYLCKQEVDELQSIARGLGLNEELLREMKNDPQQRLDEYGRFTKLKNTVDMAKAKEYFEELDKITYPGIKLKIRIHNFLKEYLERNS